MGRPPGLFLFLVVIILGAEIGVDDVIFFAGATFRPCFRTALRLFRSRLRSAWLLASLGARRALLRARLVDLLGEVIRGLLQGFPRFFFAGKIFFFFFFFFIL